MRRLLLVAAVSAACFGVVQVGVAQAADCGTITTSTTLASDCNAPLVIGASGITVDLGGHSVLCPVGDQTVGIEATNQNGVTVQNGSVTGCDDAVLFKNGDSNVFDGLTLTDNGVGFDIMDSTSNTVQNSVVTNSSATGILLFQTSGTVVKRNTVQDSAIGIFDNGGTDNLIVSNTAVFNTWGILIGAESATVVANTTSDNGTGIQVGAVHGGNRLLGNKSLGNGLDMKDEAPNCDANVWRGNKFVTANQTCIH